MAPVDPPAEPAAARTVHHRDVVVVGAGFAGLALARALGGTELTVTVVDRRNYHLFQPLLYQVATAALSPADIAEPIRKVLARHANVDVVMGELVAVEEGADCRVHLADGSVYACRRLILATGSEYDYFGHAGWKDAAPGLKTVDDAREIRSRLLLNFERAETCRDPVRQAALMTTVVIGGGPTGVEMAGAIAELCRWTLARDFRHVDPTSARVILVEAGPRLLSAFPEELSAFAAERLGRLGVTLMTGQPVEHVRENGVDLPSGPVDAGLVVWGAGIRATPIAPMIGVETDRSGRIPVGPDFVVPGHPAIHALGDLALMRVEGRPLPALAQVAKQQGEHLGRHLPAAMKAGRPVPPFHFRNRGNTAVIGRNAAVFDFGRHRLRGRLAWLLWAVVHVYLLVGFEKRLLVGVQWIWRYFTYQRGARIIR